MAIRELQLMTLSSPQGTMRVGIDYDDVAMNARVLWGRATFAARWKVSIFNATTGELVWSADRTDADASRNLSGPQRFAITRGAENELVVPISVALSPVS